MSPLPLFYILSFPLVLPKLCKCVHSASTGPECSWASPTAPTPSPHPTPPPRPPTLPTPPTLPHAFPSACSTLQTR